MAIVKLPVPEAQKFVYVNSDLVANFHDDASVPNGQESLLYLTGLDGFIRVLLTAEQLKNALTDGK